MKSVLTLALSFVAIGLGGCCGARCARPCSPCPSGVASVAPVAGTPGIAPSGGEVFVDAVFMRIPASRVEALLGSERAAQHRTVALLSSPDGIALREQATGTEGVVVLQSPKVLASSGQEATVFVGETYPMKGSSEDLSFSVESPNWAGQRVRFVTIPSADHTNVDLDFSFAFRDLPAQGDEVDLDAIRASEIRGGARTPKLPSGDFLLVVEPATGTQTKDRVVVLMSARVLSGT